jgi:hypothetical protein
MNTVLGLIVLVVNGSIQQSTTAHIYPTIKECQAQLHAAIKASGVTAGPGEQLGVLCLDLSDDINAKQTPKPPSTEL